MSYWDSTEALTKYLRSKDNQVDEIIDVAQKLIKNDQFFMPNKHSFVFQLLCDRLNDFNGKFTQWKLKYKVWNLFINLWNQLSHDITLKFFKKVRFIEVIIKVFNSNPDLQLLSSVFETIDLIKHESIIFIDENLAISLLSSYLTNILSSSSMTIDANWSKIVLDVYKIPYLHINYSLGKKNYTRFISSCCEPIIELGCNKPSQALPFEKLLIKVLFNHDLIKHLNANLSTFLIEHQNTLTKSDIIHLFKIIVENLKDIKQCEELFLIFTKDCQISQLSESLLGILACGNKALSYTFFKTIYDQEIIKSEVNWNLINYIFQLDIELAIENSSLMFNQINNANDLIVKEKMFSTLLDAHIKGREIKDFFIKIWLEAVTECSEWKNSKFVDLASKSIDKLSSRQLIELIDDLFKLNDSKNRVLPLFTAIAKGLILSTPLKVDQVKSTVISNLNYFLESFDDSFWEVRYYLLCLYKEDAGVDQIDFNSEKATMNKYFYYSIFRSIEIKGNDKPFKNYQINFLNYLKNETSILEFVLQRWLVLIEVFFDKKNLIDFINICFKNQSVDFFKNYFAVVGDIFFEQQKLSATSLDYMIHNCEDDISLVELFISFPIQCYNKVTKRKSLDKLFTIATSKSNNFKLETRNAILHILIQPTFQSKLESNLSCLIKLFETSDEDLQQISSSICQLVWSNCLKQCGDIENKRFLHESIDHLIKFLKKKPSTSAIPVTLNVASIIIPVLEQYLQIEDDLLDKTMKLKSSFYDYIKTSLNSITVSKNSDIKLMNWLIETLTTTVNTDEIPATELLDMMKSLGRYILEPREVNTIQIKQSMFKLLTRIYPVRFYDSVYILSLFYILQNNYDIVSSDDLSYYLLRLSSDQEEYRKVYEFVFSSMKDITAENSRIFADIITILLKDSVKGCSNESRLLVLSLSTILTNFDLFDLLCISRIMSALDVCLSTKSWMFQQYALETTITLLVRVAALLKDKSIGETAACLYIQTCKVMSSILLFHRYKLSSRQHLVITIFVSLMEPLCLKTSNVNISKSKDTAAAYSRLISNLCEVTSNEVSKDSLSSTSSIMKKSIRKHLPMLLINYIYLNLKFNFHSIVQEELLNGVYTVLDVLSQTELQLVSSSLDIPGKSYYRRLYSTYKEHGKWKDT